MERQIHGFIYEDKIKKRNKLSNGSYTDKWDLFGLDNKKWVVKTFKKGSELPLSDIFINSQRDEDFILQIGIWENKKDNIVEEYTINVDIEKWKIYFEFNFYDELKNWIKNKVSNSYEYDNIWKKEVKNWKKIWGESRIVQPRFKRDHKTQRRVQCAVKNKNLKKFLKSVEK